MVTKMCTDKFPYIQLFMVSLWSFLFLRILFLTITKGQVMGTAVGTELLVNRSYTFSSAVRVSFCVFQFLVLLARGPHVPRKTWFGWAGGMEFRKQNLEKKSISVVDEKGAAIETDSPA